jgi:hypothetical protein
MVTQRKRAKFSMIKQGRQTDKFMRMVRCTGRPNSFGFLALNLYSIMWGQENQKSYCYYGKKWSYQKFILFLYLEERVSVSIFIS